MHAEIIALGDELTSGQRVDTNSAWLSVKLGQLGIPVQVHTTLGDDIDMSVAAVQLAFTRSRIVVCTGGLGPTEDDLTREALAAAAGVPLILDEMALAHIESLFARRGRAMPARNRVQAMCPQGARMIPNREGTAPGLHVELAGGRCVVYALPGVPAEMKQMWAYVEASLREMQLVRNRIVLRVIKCFGYGESQIAEMLPGILDRGRNPIVGITAHEATISLRIVAKGETEQEAEQLAEETASAIRAQLGSVIFTEQDEEELQDAAVAHLRTRGWTLSSAELETAGELARRLAGTGLGRTYLGGTVGSMPAQSATSPQAVRPNADPACEGIVPHFQEVVRRANAVRHHYGSDVGIALGRFEIAPTGSPLEDGALIPGAIISPQGLQTFEHRWGGHSSVVLIRAAKDALSHLLNVARQ